MNPVVKNILAVVAGVVVGSIVNMGIIMISGSIIPPPEGGDITTMEGLKATMHLFEPKHFIFPFLAHALGTLVGAFVATKIAATRKMLMALIIGLFFLIGGTANIAMLGGPMWFTALDIIVAYMPMAYIGYMLGKK
ncbi:hypothetical protein DFQ03_2639 [Maribacter caenipelagi]|mgnify:CR=1 FL=1|uniref:Uncharacterized protein n=1 Tax=Maribacter caenipelagi TaxID=1447781 RepID=A0A4R7CZJ3_9FLAO|nr:hypothetical protein [Maribacter caenipelagi]TDS13352.1 hypothetical protein DFQ03_2639 [Maribacter caenipelagi]